MKRTCLSTGSWRCCLNLEVMCLTPVGSTIIYRYLCRFICISLCQSIKIKPTNIYVTSARAQFKINTLSCLNWQLCIPDGLSVVQWSLRHFLWNVFWHNSSGMKRTCLTTGSWWFLPQPGGREFDLHRVHDNLSVPLWIYMRFPAPEHQNPTNKCVSPRCGESPAPWWVLWQN